MTISAKIVADSRRGESGSRLTTFELYYPRFIHAEFMTHRLISRNASSSRATPVATMIKAIEDDPAMPIEFGKNKKGMQSGGEHDAEIDFYSEYEAFRLKYTKEQLWLEEAMRYAIKCAKAFNEAGYHKQVVNRILEPYSHIRVLATATEWENFFALRAHPDAQPEIRVLAEKMLEVMRKSLPIIRTGTDPDDINNWHLPYISDVERSSMASRIAPELREGRLQKMSAARCARVSYFNFDGSNARETKDLELYEKLAGSVPLHASPLEHQAFPCPADRPGLQGNFKGWAQFRKMHENESSSYAI